MNTSIMNATATITSAVSAAETAEKVSAIAKAKAFVKEHKTAFVIGTTAITGVGAGIIIGNTAPKIKDKIKSKKQNAEKEMADEDITADPTPVETTEEPAKNNGDVIDVDPTPVNEDATPAEKQEEAPSKETCKDCDKQHSA